jgi:hypothetical protein
MNQYPCLVVAGCKYNGNSSHALRQHVWSTHGPGAALTTCLDCHMQCTVYELTQHKRTCIAQASLSCNVCNKTLKNRRSFNKHNRSQSHASALSQKNAQPVIHVVNMEQVVMRAAMAPHAALPPFPPVPAVIGNPNQFDDDASFSFDGGFDGYFVNDAQVPVPASPAAAGEDYQHGDTVDIAHADADADAHAL